MFINRIDSSFLTILITKPEIFSFSLKKMKDSYFGFWWVLDKQKIKINTRLRKRKLCTLISHIVMLLVVADIRQTVDSNFPQQITRMI